MRRREALGLLAGAALSRPLRAMAAPPPLLEESAGFAGQIFFIGQKPPAFVLGVVRDGETAVFGFGKRGQNAPDEPKADTLFRIGSITKAFTGQVLASLAADGIVKLTDPVTKYAPAFDAAMSKDRPIRLIDLATHSSGLPREVPREDGPPDDPFVHVTLKAYSEWMKSNPLLFPPGSAVLYSNFGFDVLAAALSLAAGKPYPELLAERVLKPLGLKDTTFAPVDAQNQRLMQGHWIDGSPMPFVPTGDVIVGAGGLYSSAGDLLRWLQWHLDRFASDGAATRLIDHAAWLQRDGLTAVSGMDESGHMDAMGLGWIIMEPEGTRPLILQKAGGLQGVFSYVAFSPARNIGVVAAINAFNVGAGLEMAKLVNGLIADLAPR